MNRDGEMGDAQICGSDVSPPLLTGLQELRNDQNAVLTALCRDKGVFTELPPHSLCFSVRTEELSVCLAVIDLCIDVWTYIYQN